MPTPVALGGYGEHVPLQAAVREVPEQAKGQCFASLILHAGEGPSFRP
jgi:hypothetical protein